MYWTYVIIAAIFLSSCGGILRSSDKKVVNASIENLLIDEDRTISQEVTEKLYSIHSYYLIGLNHLLALDHDLEDTSLTKIYSGKHYQSLLAVKSQIDELQAELIAQARAGRKQKEIVQKSIGEFSKQGPLKAMGLQNLAFELDLKLDFSAVKISKELIDQEMVSMGQRADFLIYEKNIQHLSHLLQYDIKSEKIRETSITGNDFPKSHWALTFSNGPSRVTSEISQELKKRNLVGTFFQIAQKSLETPALSRELLKDKMEIGHESFSHKDLGKVGALTLEKEITFGTQELEKALKIDIRFFRLPYAGGATASHVKEVIEKNKLISVLWNVDALDWMAQEPDRIVKRTRLMMKKTPRESGIILFHDTHPRSAKAAKVIMDDLKSNLKTTCPLNNIVQDMKKEARVICSSTSF